MPPESNFHKQLVTFVAACVLFLGSLAYVVSVAFKNGAVLNQKNTANLPVDYAEDLQ